MEQFFKEKRSYLVELFASDSVDLLAKEWYSASRLREVGAVIKNMISELTAENAWKYGLDSNASFREFVEAYDEKIYQECGSFDPNVCLEYFALKGDKPRVLLAIRKGAENLVSGFGAAARGGHMNLISFFIARGVYFVDLGLYEAARGGHMDLVLFFLKLHATDLKSGLEGAIESGNMDLVLFFIEKNSFGWDREHALLKATEEGNLELVLFFSEIISEMPTKAQEKIWEKAKEIAKERGYESLVEFFSSKM